MLVNIGTFIGEPSGAKFFAYGFSLTAPVATWISDAATAQAVFEIDVDSGVVSGDKIWGESSTDNFTTVLETVSAAIGAPDLVDFQIDDFAFSPFADGLTYVRFWISNSANAQISPKSIIISETIDTTAPALSSPADTATGQTTADVGVTTNEANGTLYCVVTTSGTAPSAAQVKAGQDNSSVAATFADNLAIASTGVKTFNATGLTAATAYTAHFMHEDALGNPSTVSSGNGFTTDSAATAPVVAATNTSTQTLNSGHVANLPASISAGNLLLLAISTVLNPAATTISTPSGWTQLGTSTQGFNCVSVFWKIASGLEGGTVLVTFGTNARAAAASYRITGHDVLQAPEIAFAANSKDPPNLTPSWGSAADLWIAGSSGDSDSDVAAPTYPTGYTGSQLNSSIAANGDGARVALATKEATTTSDDPSAYTIVESSPVSFTIAVKPA